MKNRWLFLSAIWLATQIPAPADSPLDPFPWVTTSPKGDHLLKMVPGTWVRNEAGEWALDRPPFGVAYTVTENGDFRELWRVSGWYAPKGYLSDNGRYFVRLGPWASDQENHTDLAIAFYDGGTLLKAYQVRDLIKNSDHISYSVSHYEWQPGIQTTPDGLNGDSFHLTLIDKTTHRFDLKTGLILETGFDSGARSQREIWEERRTNAEKKGRLLLEKSDALAGYQNRFRISEIDAGDGKISGVHFTGPEWRAKFAPTRKHLEYCTVEAVFPIGENQQIETSLSPDEIEETLENALRHPFVRERFTNDGATGLRLRITGDRLHWDTKRLGELLNALTGASPAPAELRDWAYLIIDAREPRFTSVYFNRKSRELIFTLPEKWPEEPVLLDATGQRIGRTP